MPTFRALSGGSVRLGAGSIRIIPDPPPPQAATSLDIGGAALNPFVTEGAGNTFGLTPSGGNPQDYTYEQRGTWPAWASLNSGLARLVISNSVPLGGNNTQLTIRVRNNAGALFADFVATIGVVASGADLQLAEFPLFTAGSTVNNGMFSIGVPVADGTFDDAQHYIKLKQKSTGLELPWASEEQHAVRGNGFTKMLIASGIVPSLAGTYTDAAPDAIQVIRATGARPTQTPATLAQLKASNLRHFRVNIEDVTVNKRPGASTQYICNLQTALDAATVDTTPVWSSTGPSYLGRWRRGTRLTTFIFEDSPVSGGTPHPTLRIKWEVQVRKTDGINIDGVSVWATFHHGWKGDTTTAETNLNNAGSKASAHFGYNIQRSVDGTNWTTVEDSPVLRPNVSLTRSLSSNTRLVSADTGVLSWTTAHNGYALWESPTTDPDGSDGFCGWLSSPTSTSEIRYMNQRWRYNFTQGSSAVVAGDTIRPTGGDTTRLLVTEVVVTSGTWAGGDAAGTIVIAIRNGGIYDVSTPLRTLESPTQILVLSPFSATTNVVSAGNYCMAKFMDCYTDYVRGPFVNGTWPEVHCAINWEYGVQTKQIPAYTSYTNNTQVNDWNSWLSQGTNLGAFGWNGGVTSGDSALGPYFNQRRAFDGDGLETIGWSPVTIASLKRPTLNARNLAIYSGMTQRSFMSPGRVPTKNGNMVSWNSGGWMWCLNAIQSGTTGVISNAGSTSAIGRTFPTMAFASLKWLDMAGISAYYLTGCYWAFENVVASLSASYQVTNSNSNGGSDTTSRNFYSGELRSIAHNYAGIGMAARAWPKSFDGILGHGVTAAEVRTFAGNAGAQARTNFESNYPGSYATGVPPWLTSFNNTFNQDQLGASYTIEFYGGTFEARQSDARWMMDRALEAYGQFFTNPGIDPRQQFGGSFRRAITGRDYSNATPQTAGQLSAAGPSVPTITGSHWYGVSLDAQLSATSGDNIVVTLSMPGNPSWPGLNQTDGSYWVNRAIWFSSVSPGTNSGVNVHARITELIDNKTFRVSNAQVRCVPITGGTTYAANGWMMQAVPTADRSILTNVAQTDYASIFSLYAYSLFCMAATEGEPNWENYRAQMSTIIASTGFNFLSSSDEAMLNWLIYQ